MAGEQALKHQEDLLLLGETEAEGARLPMFGSGRVCGRSASEPPAPRFSASAVAPD